MKTISARDLVNFTRKTEKSKQTFALKVKTEVDKSNSGSGGDYWVHSISAICNSIKLNDIVPIEEKKEILVNKHYNSSVQRSKVMYERNIRVLDTFADMDFSSWAPDSGPKFKKIPQKPFVLMFNGVGIKVRPNLLFSFNLNDNTPQIGAIWFVPNVDGFKKTELGLFVNLLYEYLIQKHGEPTLYGHE